MGAALASALGPGEMVFLEGELGAGKTTLAKAMFSALGVASEDVSSPTFDLMRIYSAQSGRQLLHADLFRLSTLQDVESLGIDEWVAGGASALLEWAGPWMEPMRWKGVIIQLRAVNENSRVMSLSAQDERAHQRLVDVLCRLPNR